MNIVIDEGLAWLADAIAGDGLNRVEIWSEHVNVARIDAMVAWGPATTDLHESAYAAMGKHWITVEPSGLGRHRFVAYPGPLGRIPNRVPLRSRKGAWAPPCRVASPSVLAITQDATDANLALLSPWVQDPDAMVHAIREMGTRVISVKSGDFGAINAYLPWSDVVATINAHEAVLAIAAGKPVMSFGCSFYRTPAVAMCCCSLGEPMKRAWRDWVQGYWAPRVDTQAEVVKRYRQIDVGQDGLADRLLAIISSF